MLRSYRHTWNAVSYTHLDVYKRQETAIVGKVSPQQLTAVDGAVNFNYNIAFAPKQFYKKLILKVTPKMQYPGGEEAMGPLYFQGVKVKGTDYPVVEYKGNTLGKMCIRDRERA